MKILTQSEISNLSKLIKSDDESSRKLAVTILRRRTLPIVFDFVIASILLILSIWGAIELFLVVNKAFYVVIFLGLLCVISIISLYLATCIISKKSYDEVTKWMFDGDD